MSIAVDDKQISIHRCGGFQGCKPTWGHHGWAETEIDGADEILRIPLTNEQSRVPTIKIQQPEHRKSFLEGLVHLYILAAQLA